MSDVKISKTLLLFAALLIAAAPQVSAQTAAGQHCDAAQYYLKNTQRSRDLRSRVDRLQTYQYVQKRLDDFVSRMERHNQPGHQTLRVEVDSYEKGIELFKQSYELYDHARDEVTSLKSCTDNPARFSEYLTKAREERASVRTAIKNIDATHQAIIDQLKSIKLDVQAEEVAGE